MAPLVIAYWDIRGLVQPIRLLLEQSGLEWEDKLFVTGGAPTFDKSCWFDIKESLGFDFPNLPYMIDGEVKLTQTMAILRYIARKCKGMEGVTEEERRRVDLVQAEWEDFKSPFVSMCYNPNFKEMRDDYVKSVGVKLKRFEKFLGDRPYFAGENLTFVDFLMYEMLDEHKVLEPKILEGFPALEKFQERIESLPRIAKYIKSPKFIKYPLNNRMAYFGG